MKTRLFTQRATIALGFAIVLIGSACTNSPQPVAIVNGVTIGQEEFAALHVDIKQLDDDEAAGSVLLLVIHNAFTASAREDLGIEPDRSTVDELFATRTQRQANAGDLDEQLALENVTRQRVQLEAELDEVKTAVGAHLVRTEASGFDLAGAYEAFLLDTAEVCVQQIQLADATEYDEVIERLDSGEAFADVARDVSIDPSVDREPGLIGAGGDLGCSNPGALPTGLAEAAITSPLGKPVGPVNSAVGVHVLLVRSRTAAPLSEARADVIEHAVPLQSAELFRIWAVRILQTISVELGTDYGRWAVLPETEPVPTVVPEYLFDSIISS